MNISYKEAYKHIRVKYNPGDIHDILIIDNNIAMLYTLQDVLIVEGYHVSIARAYQEALVLSHKLRFNAILADVDSNTSCELDSLNEIKIANPDVMIFLMTAYDIEHPLVKQTMSEGFTVLFKPFKMDMLLHTLDQVSVT